LSLSSTGVGVRLSCSEGARAVETVIVKKWYKQVVVSRVLGFSVGIVKKKIGYFSGAVVVLWWKFKFETWF
jgi:hypothetical protein